MSRMYSMLSSGAAPRVAAGADPAGAPAAVRPFAPDPAAADEFVPDAADTPYVEVGGPAGPVYSAGPGAGRPAPPKPTTPPAPPVVARAAEPKPTPPAVSRAPAADPAPRSYPRLAGVPAYLSVRFHDLTGQPRPKSDFDGPDPGLVALHFPDHPVSGEYRVLRDEVRAQLPDPVPRVLFFTAASGEAGTTTVLLNLAVTIAHEGGPRVLVVDANVSRPGGAQKLALRPTPGLVEVLGQQVPLAWAVRPSVVPNLQVLPAGGAAGGPPTAFGQDLPKLIEQLRQWYDWVLVDAGVWGMIPERDAACPAADAVYLVTREADADRSEFAGLRGWVRELGGMLRGYVATRS